MALARKQSCIWVIIWVAMCPSTVGLLVFGGAFLNSPIYPSFCTTVWNLDGTLSKLTCSTDNVTVTSLADLVNNISQTTQFKLTLLTVRDTLLTDLPVNICRLKLVEELDLSNNKLTEISPSNCFTGMENLRKLDLSRNSLLSLPGGIFRSLQKLEYLNISNNKVKFIDPQVFSNASDLKSLRTIDFARNSINSIDPWPLIRGLVVPGCSVNLRLNAIDTFTNSINFRYRCGMEPLQMTLDLSKNAIKHFTDIPDGWGFDKFVNFMCIFGNGSFSKFDLIFRAYGLLCDCKDYRVFNIFMQNAYVILLNEAFCNAPPRLAGKRFLALQPADMVCDVSVQCPNKCICYKQPSTKTIFVNCSNTGLIDLPALLPPLNNSLYKYHLDFSGNHLERLNYEDYIEKASSIDVSNSSVGYIAPRMWEALLNNLNEIILKNNLLTSFPETQSNSFQGQLDIQGNPILCDCSNQWLSTWLVLLKENLVNPSNIYCSAPDWNKEKNVVKMNSDDFCSGPPYTLEYTDVLKIAIPSVCGLILFNIVAVLLLQKFRLKMFKYTKIHPFDRDECKDEDIENDVFLACSSEDGIMGISLMALLESEGYKVCYHQRDFMPGAPISENIINAIVKSKRVLCVMTRNFINSQYCMEEFRMAHHRDLQKEKKRLILLLVDSIGHFQSEDVAAELRDYMKRYTYIEMEEIGWKDHLMYAMPVNRMIDNNNNAVPVTSRSARDRFRSTRRLRDPRRRIGSILR